MRYGKIYFYDRMGNRIAISDSAADRAYKRAFFKPPGFTTDHQIAVNNILAEPPATFRVPPQLTLSEAVQVPPLEGLQSEASFNMAEENEADAPEAPPPAENGGEAKVPKLNETYMKMLEEHDDEDLCESCRWREMHLASVAAQQEQTQRQVKEEQHAIRNYFKRQEEIDNTHRQEQLQKTKSLQHEVNEINKKMVEDKRLPRQPSAEGGYLLYNRPDTATVNRQKQRNFHEELTRQVEAKKALAVREREAELNESSRQNFSTKNNIDREHELERLRDMRKKNEYRHALDAQIAARNVEQMYSENGDPWWTRREEFKGPEGLTEQTERVQKQAQAIENLEQFLKKQQQEDAAARESERERRMHLLEVGGQLASPAISGRTPQSPIDPERQRQVEQAWIQASEEHQKQYHPLQRNDGSIMDQIKKYRRCRKCNKSLPEHLQTHQDPEKYWVDLDKGYIRPLENADTPVWNGHKSH